MQTLSIGSLISWVLSCCDFQFLRSLPGVYPRRGSPLSAQRWAMQQSGTGARRRARESQNFSNYGNNNGNGNIIIGPRGFRGSVPLHWYVRPACDLSRSPRSLARGLVELCRRRLDGSLRPLRESSARTKVKSTGTRKLRSEQRFLPRQKQNSRMHTTLELQMDYSSLAEQEQAHFEELAVKRGVK